MEFPTFTELRNSTAAELDASGLTDVRNPGTASEQIVSSFTAQSSRVAGYGRRIFSNAFVHNATGIYLDIHGEKYGIRRRETLPAVVFADDRILRIKANRGTLRDRIGSEIAAGTTVSTPDSTITYTISETDIPAGVSELFVTAISNNDGPAGNVGSNELTVLSISVDGVEITNVAPIRNGIGRETDREYRARLLAVVQGNNSASEGTMVATALSVPGVTFATIVENAFGINHPALIVSGPDKIRAGIVARVEAAVTPLLPFGSRITVLSPTFRELDLTLVVNVRDEFRNDTTKAQIRQVVQAEFFPHAPGTEFRLDRLDQIITRSVSSVLDVELSEIIIDGAKYGTDIIRTEAHEQIVLGALVIELI